MRSSRARTDNPNCTAISDAGKCERMVLPAQRVASSAQSSGKNVLSSARTAEPALQGFLHSLRTPRLMSASIQPFSKVPSGPHRTQYRAFLHRLLRRRTVPTWFTIETRHTARLASPAEAPPISQTREPLCWPSSDAGRYTLLSARHARLLSVFRIPVSILTKRANLHHESGVKTAYVGRGHGSCTVTPVDLQVGCHHMIANARKLCRRTQLAELVGVIVYRDQLGGPESFQAKLYFRS